MSLGHAFACGFFILRKDSQLYHLACFGIDRSCYIQIATVRLPPSRKLNNVPLPPLNHLDVSNHKRIVDGDAYTRSEATGIGWADSYFGDLHGTPLEPKVCRAELNLDAVSCAQNGGEHLCDMARISGWKVYSGRGSLTAQKYLDSARFAPKIRQSAR